MGALSNSCPEPDILRFVIGILLVCIPLLLLFQGTAHMPTLSVRLTPTSRSGVSLIGLFAGFFVGVSSVGSGTVILALLILLIRCSPSVLVGTDILHAVILTGLTSLLYLRLGTVDLDWCWHF